MFKTAFLFLLLFTTSIQASEIALFGTSCETIKEGEKRSSAISRAADKASFEAVSHVNEFMEIKNSVPDYEFNALIYDAVDNNISDLIIKTKKSEKAKVCVEVSGYLNTDTLNLPETQIPESIIPVDINSKDMVIYIAPTYYFNNTQSKSVSKIIEENFKHEDDLLITDDLSSSDYIIYPKVLKAKIDNINSSTKRFHMIISLEVQNNKEEVLTTEHQNKFILLEATDDEQEKAKELMTKLFKAASVSILTKLETISKTNSQSLLNSGK
ncbi:MAG: hypothetical protein R3Y43_03920 [Alphaproteobacteria bacterium]